MPTIQDVCDFLEELAPSELAEDWDNVGLLVGDRGRSADRIMTCLTISGSTAQEAIDGKADLIVTHHPLPFRPLKRLTTDTPEGRNLLDLIGAGVAIYSAHTAFDSAHTGINQRWAAGLGLADPVPLVPEDETTDIGKGRIGSVASGTTLGQLCERVKQFLALDRLRVVGDGDQEVQRVAVACGSAGEFLEPARWAGVDVLVTGETSFHTCLAAEAHGMGLILTGHFASERFAMDCLAEVLSAHFAGINIWASQHERDPLNTF